MPVPRYVHWMPYASMRRAPPICAAGMMAMLPSASIPKYRPCISVGTRSWAAVSHAVPA